MIDRAHPDGREGLTTGAQANALNLAGSQASVGRRTTFTPPRPDAGSEPHP
jgi:hypothetical protein